MVDITFKQNSLRTAIAQAIVTVSREETIADIKENRVPKGNVFEMSKTAGLFAVKRTSDMIPDCHPLPVEFTHVGFEVKGMEIIIQVTVSTIYKTGVEVEAMHGASVVALTLYDMLKPIDKGVEINNIKLLMKSGGKSGLKKKLTKRINASLIVASDSIFNGSKKDKITANVKAELDKFGIDLVFNCVISDNQEIIREHINKRVAEKDSLIITSGGTGLTTKDFLPETVVPLLDRRIPGIEEMIRRYGQERTSRAMFSRSVAGMIGSTLVLSLPGSSSGMEESLQGLFPYILPVFDVVNV